MTLPFAFINRYMEDDEIPKYTVTNTGENGVSIKTDYVTVSLEKSNTHCMSDSLYLI